MSIGYTRSVGAAIGGIAVPALLLLGAGTAHADPESNIGMGIPAEACVDKLDETGNPGTQVGLSNPVATRVLTLW